MSRGEQKYLGSSYGESQPPISGRDDADALLPFARYQVSLTVQLSLRGSYAYDFLVFLCGKYHNLPNGESQALNLTFLTNLVLPSYDYLLIKLAHLGDCGVS